MPISLLTHPTPTIEDGQEKQPATEAEKRAAEKGKMSAIIATERVRQSRDVVLQSVLRQLSAAKL